MNSFVQLRRLLSPPNREARATVTAVTASTCTVTVRGATMVLNTNGLTVLVGDSLLIDGVTIRGVLSGGHTTVSISVTTPIT